MTRYRLSGYLHAPRFCEQNLWRGSGSDLILFHLVHGVRPDMNLAAGLFILPFFLFSATAGQIADKMEKSLLIRRIRRTRSESSQARRNVSSSYNVKPSP